MTVVRIASVFLMLPTNAAVTFFRSCWRFFASSSLRFASLTLCDLVHQTADENGCILPHKNFISSVSFNTLYTTYVLRTISTVCLPVPSVGHWWDRQTGHFQGPVYLSHLSDKDGTGRLAIFTDLSVPSVPSCFSETELCEVKFLTSYTQSVETLHGRNMYSKYNYRSM